MSARPLLHIVDGSGYIFRAYYAIRGLSTSSGEPTNAVFGFAQMLLKAVADERPQHLALTFDTGRPSFRQAIYPAYKANRPPPPEDLPPQIPRIHEVAATFRMRTFVIDGFEADDVIATLSRRAIEAGYDVRIITGDKDLMQLVTDRVTLFDPMKEKRYGREDVIERFGVAPEHVVDVLALAGDATDNVPGVRGVGEKTAAKLIATHGSLAGVVAAAKSGAIKGKTGEVIVASEEIIETSRRLVVLDEQVPLDITMEALAYPGPDYRAQLALFEQLELKRLLPRVAEQEGAGAAPTPKAGPLSVVRVSPEHYEVVVERARVEAVAAELAQAERVGLSVELSTEHVADAEVYGLSVCGRAGYSYYLPVGHNYLGVPRQLPLTEVLGILRPVLEDATKPKVGLGIKSVWSLCAREGVALRGLAGDGELASYLLDPDDGPHEAREVSHKFVGHALVDRDELLGRGKKRRSFGELTVEEALPVAAERADVAFRAYTPWSEALSEAGLTAMSTDLELPLVSVLGRLELSGVRVDVPRLSEMGGVFEAELSRLEKVCYEAAGQELNLGSPKQLQKVLFEDLGLRIVKRTKTGPSTDASALEAIVDDHPLPQAILDYRQIQKLKSTYVDALPKLVSPRTGRVHTILNQAVAATGRLSSIEPNLQNIPIRTELGRQLRRVFVAAPGRALISVDYSQIELRVMAHISHDPVLTDAFTRNIDVHKRTAAALFDVDVAAVTPEQRGQAKTVNFGVLYGMGPVRLARQLGIPRREASKFVDEYFARQPGVKQYIEDTLVAAREKGYVFTLLGRRRRVADINSKNRTVRMGAERIAVNTPIQGTAADLIKLAMLRVDARLREEHPQVALILQVHDELLLEAPAAEAEAVALLVKREMERAYPLDVPLVAEVHWGSNWDQAH